MTIRLLHLADCRLGSAHAYMGERAAARRDEAHATFQRAVEFALDPAREIHGVVVAGDLFDACRPDADTVALARGSFARLAANGRAVVVLPGFHDGAGRADSVWRNHRMPGVEVLASPRRAAPAVKELNGVRVFFYGIAHVPGRTGDVFEGFDRVDEPGVHVGVLHGLVPGHPEAAARPWAWTLPSEALAASRMDYVALGGAHGFTEYRLGDVAAAYAGAPEGLGFGRGETGRKPAVVAVLGDGPARLETSPVSRRVVVDETIDLDAEQIRDSEALRGALLARAGDDVLARFTLQGVREFVCDVAAVAAALDGRFHRIEIVDRSGFEHGALIRRIGGEGTIRGFFVRRMRRRLDALNERLARNPADPAARRELVVAERALTIGLEQFVEVDAPAPAAEPARGGGDARDSRGRDVPDSAASAAPVPPVAPPEPAIVRLNGGAHAAAEEA